MARVRRATRSQDRPTMALIVCAAIESAGILSTLVAGLPTTGEKTTGVPLQEKEGRD